MPALPTALLLSLALLAITTLPASAQPAQAPASGIQAVTPALPFAQPRPGLYSAGQPSAEQLARAAAAGITTVIDLRGAGEARGYDQAAAARELGLHYVALPIAGSQAVSVEAARALHALLAGSDGPVLLHCASGNRAGALLALAAAHVDGADNEAALALGRAAGLTSLSERVLPLLPGAALDEPAHADHGSASDPQP